jgi:hypothetical protein
MSKGKIEKWKKDIGRCDKVAFRKHERKLVLALFDLSLKHAFENACQSDWIELECRWRNTGY